MTSRLLAGLIVATVSFAAAQESGTASPETTRQVTGAVVDADTGQPIDGARLQLFGADHIPLVFTGKDGLFAAVIPGDSRPMVQASAEGYITDFSRALRGCSPCNVTFRLHAKAAFNGRVVAADNTQPIMQVLVEAFPFVSGQLSALPAGRAWTDRRGWFSLEQLPAGQYFFRFTPPDPVASLSFSDTDDTQSRRFRVQWWPGGEDWEQSSPYAIAAGSGIRLPDFQLTPDARFIVSGTVLPQYCRGDESFKISILQREGGSSKTLRSLVVNCGAEYSFPDLASGNYQIAVDKTPQYAPAKVDVQVRSENVRADLPVVAQPGVSGLPGEDSISRAQNVQN